MNSKPSLFIIGVVCVAAAAFVFLGREVALFDPLDEASGLVASSRHPGVFWSLNDSGGAPILFALNHRRELLARLWVEGAENRDWESLSMDESGHFLVMDSGNNDNDRTDLCVYRVPEPDALAPFDTVMQAPSERFDFHYPEQSAFPDDTVLNFDSEASFYMPGTETEPGRLFLLTKHRSDTNTVLYAFPMLSTGDVLALRKVDEFDVGGGEAWFGGRVTGADIDAHGHRLAVLTYHRIYVFDVRQRPILFGDPIASLALMQSETQQVEAIAWSGDTLIVLNEQGRLWQIPEEIWNEPAAVFPAAL